MGKVLDKSTRESHTIIYLWRGHVGVVPLFSPDVDGGRLAYVVCPGYGRLVLLPFVLTVRRAFTSKDINSSLDEIAILGFGCNFDGNCHEIS